MSGQADFRMPATGEAWRHYKGGSSGLYTIVGMARDDEGYAVVVYTPYGWSLVQLAPLYTQRLSRFLQDMPGFTPRFKFVREAGSDPRCQYLAIERAGRGE